ncbi:hypothetical protein CL634_00370 [bacterium]|nr:hypothetical protein [bacterium]|tara:strand:- start:499 stop:918 length:420 start_codon:yes stop_codon:yes gene_type:complete
MVIMDDYDAGFEAGQRSQWIDIEDHPPEMKRQVIYFHDDTGGAHIGFYFGRDEEYPCENNHVFGSNVGYLTGDATHWMYMPEDPFEDEYLQQRRQEWIDEAYADLDESIKRCKEPIGIFSQMKDRMDRVKKNTEDDNME